MKIKSCSEFLNEEIEAPATQDTNVDTLKKSFVAYTQNKPKVDAIINNKNLTDEQLQAEFDKISNNVEGKELITFYFSTKKLERQKVALEAQAKQIATQIQQRSAELATMEKGAQ